MKKTNFPEGIWPVMLTPFTEDNQVDYPALKELVEWYIKNGVDGLFAVCQSSEMFSLSLDERIKIAVKVKEYAAGRVPVVASGHISDSIEGQIQELKKMAATGVDAVVLITNRMASSVESDDVWIANTARILDGLPADQPLGLYECPQPYKRLMTEKTMRWCVSTKRFGFLKDTSCDLSQIQKKLQICEGSDLKLYNANSATLLRSLELGGHGYCGVMANMHPRLYRFLYDHYKDHDLTVLAEFLTMAALIEHHCYPVNAKYYLSLENLPVTLHTRVRDAKELSDTFRLEIRMLKDLSERIESDIKKGESIWQGTLL